MTISRRKLVGAAGLLPPFAAAFTLSSAVKASEPETSDAESCSVAVIGAGAAGLAAAIAAKEAGAVRVVVLEKTALAGGHMMVSSGMLNAVDPEGQKRFGRTDSAEHFFRDTYEGGGGLGDPDLIATMVRSSADVFAWLKSLGVEFDPALYEAYTGVYPRAHRTIQARSGMAYSRALMRRARKLGVEVRYRQRVEALVMHNGRVLGVELTDMDADSPQHKTLMAKSVVIASGGFGANRLMRARWAPWIWGLHTARGELKKIRQRVTASAWPKLSVQVWSAWSMSWPFLSGADECSIIPEQKFSSLPAAKDSPMKRPRGIPCLPI